MKLRPADRRRLVFASVLTAVVFPAVWWENNQNSAANRHAVAAVGLAAPGPGATPSPTSSVTVPAPAYLAARPAPVEIPTSATLLVGPSTDDLLATTEAIFDNRLDRPDVCWFGGADPGATITVVNRANGQSLACRVARADDRGANLVVLSPAGFADLADFPDAPIHVDVRD